MIKFLKFSFFLEKAFPATLSNVERCFVHQTAQTMGLKSNSVGKGEDRYLTVTKKGMSIIFSFPQTHKPSIFLNLFEFLGVLRLLKLF